MLPDEFSKLKKNLSKQMLKPQIGILPSIFCYLFREILKLLNSNKNNHLYTSEWLINVPYKDIHYEKLDISVFSKHQWEVGLNDNPRIANILTRGVGRIRTKCRETTVCVCLWAWACVVVMFFRSPPSEIR